MFFFAGHHPDFFIVPTIGVGDAVLGCECGNCAGWRVFFIWAGFEVGFGLLRKPKAPHQ
jgi:hypothetical protein